MAIRVSDAPHVDIYPVDEENQRTILAQIDNDSIKDESGARAFVDTLKFSSDAVRIHTANNIAYLLGEGAFNRPPMKGIEMNMVDTDSSRLAVLDALELDNDARFNSL